MDESRCEAEEWWLWEIAERQNFLLKLSDALVELPHPAAIRHAACRMLREKLAADHAFYATIHQQTGYMAVECDDTQIGIRPLTGSYRLSANGWILPLCTRGRPMAVNDLATSPEIPVQQRSKLAAARLAACAGFPIVKQGALVGALCVADAQPHVWTEQEIGLVAETAERLWASVERARGQEALHQSEEKYRTLFADRQEAQEQLRKIEKIAAAGQLAASIAHEINNPLASVTNILYLLQHEEGINDTARKYVQLASVELDRISRIVKQSLSYYRKGSEPKVLNLGDLLHESLQLFAPRFERSRIQVVSAIENGALLLGFAGEIRQVADNLLMNAVEAMPQGGKLRVSVRVSRDWKHRDQHGVRLTIADSGAGIPAGLIPRLCEPFFTTKEEKGTGLGLWVSSGIIAKHGGSLKVSSSVIPGRSGTAISIFFPGRPRTAGDAGGWPDQR